MLISILNLHHIIFKNEANFYNIVDYICLNLRYFKDKNLLKRFASLIGNYLNSNYLYKFYDFQTISLTTMLLNIHNHLNILNMDMLHKSYDQIYKMFSGIDKKSNSVDFQTY